MSTGHPISRRRALSGLAVSVGGTALTLAGLPGTAEAAPTDGRPLRKPQRTTQNGWPVLKSGSAKVFQIEGSTASVPLLPGATAVVLLYVARRYNYEIGRLKGKDVHGWTSKPTGKAPFESNYLSGTAVSIRPELFPAGASGTLFPPQVALIRDILLECAGTVRWGGDEHTPKEGHFQIDVPPGSAALQQVAARFQGWATLPSQGPGTPVDPFEKRRRTAAVDLGRKQRASAPRP